MTYKAPIEMRCEIHTFRQAHIHFMIITPPGFFTFRHIISKFSKLMSETIENGSKWIISFWSSWWHFFGWVSAIEWLLRIFTSRQSVVIKIFWQDVNATQKGRLLASKLLECMCKYFGNVKNFEWKVPPSKLNKSLSLFYTWVKLGLDDCL